MASGAVSGSSGSRTRLFGAVPAVGGVDPGYFRPDDDSDDDTEDLLDLAEGLQQELRQILERRASRQKERDEGASDTEL